MPFFPSLISNHTPWLVYRRRRLLLQSSKYCFSVTWDIFPRPESLKLIKSRAMTHKEANPNLVKLESACSDLKALLQASEKMEEKLGNTLARFDLLERNLSITSRRVAPIQSLAMSTKALEARINRALSPAHQK